MPNAALSKRWRLPSEDDLPHSDGEPLDSARHRLAMQMLIDPLEAWLARQGRHDVFVAGNMGIYFSAQQVRNNDFRAPDFFLVLNTTARERKSWVVWQEGGQGPDVVVEILSERTEAEDRGRKMWIYAHTLKVPLYCLYDPFTGALEGYGLDPFGGGYRPLHDLGQPVPGPMGLELATWDGLWHGIRAPWLRWRVPEGDWLSTHEERFAAASSLANEAKRRADEVSLRADEAGARADREAARAQRLAAKLAALGLDAED